MSVKVPTMGRVTELGKDAVVAGLIGGGAMSLGQMLMGPLGGGLAAVLGGAAIGGTPGTIVAISGVMNSMAAFTAGLTGTLFGGIAGAAGANTNVM